MSFKEKYSYKYPYDLNQAKKHRQASRIFKTFTTKQSFQQCQCCHKKLGDIQDVKKSIFFNPIQLSYLGPGISLFFNFLSSSIFLIFFFIIIYSSFCIFSNRISESCQQTKKCENNFDMFSILNKQNSVIQFENQFLLILIFNILSFFILQFLRFEVKKLEQKCDFLVDSPSDYAIMIRRLPENVTQADIRQMVEKKKKLLTFEQSQQCMNLQINHIVMSYCMKDYRKIKQKNLENLRKAIANDNYQQFLPENLPELKDSGDVCIVVFERQQSKNYFHYESKIIQKLFKCFCSPCLPLSNYQVKGEKVCIQRAPEPEDINWENANVQIQEAVKRKAKFNFFGISLLLIGCGIQISLAIMQASSSTDAKIYLGFLSSLIISVSNYGILEYLMYASRRQKNLTSTEYNTVLMVKISLLQFLNAGIILLFAKFIANPLSFQFSDTLVFEINTIMVLNGVSHNAGVFILDYFEVSNKLQIYLIQKNIIKPTQIQANGLHQSPLPDMPYKYGYIVKTIWLTAFYSAFVPVSAFYSLFGLCINFFMEKILFSRTYSAPLMISSSLNVSALQLMELCPLMVSFGGLVIYIYYFNLISWLGTIYFIVSIGVGVAIILIPMEHLTEKIFYQKTDKFISFSDYFEVENNFDITYSNSNPAYSKAIKCKKSSRKPKMFRIGQYKQITLDENTIINDSYQEILDRNIQDYVEEKQKNLEIQMRFNKQREQFQNQNKFLLANFETEAGTSEKRSIQQQRDPLLLVRKIRGLQVYNPTVNQKDVGGKCNNEHQYKNFINDTKRISHLIGNPFTKTNQMLKNLNLQKAGEGI